MIRRLQRHMIDGMVAKAVNGAIEKDVKKRLGIGEFLKALVQ